MNNIKKKVSLISCLILSLIMLSWQTDNYRKNLLILKDQDGKFRTIQNENDWYKRREQILDSIQLVMGPLPDISNKVPLGVIVFEDEDIGRDQAH